LTDVEPEAIMLRRPSNQSELVAPATEPVSGPLWHSGKLGNGISLNADLSTMSRRAKTGWGTQLAETWYGNMAPEDQATIVLEIAGIGENAFIGAVGHNFYPGIWDVPLKESHHFSGIELATGDAFEKTLPCLQKLSPMGKGARLRISFDVPQRELVIEQLRELSDEARYSVNLRLPSNRVCLAVCFGPGNSEAVLQSVEGFKARMLKANKQRADLWDPENAIPPPDLGGRLTTQEEAVQKVRENELKVAALL
jgi:hypothetical protein